MSDFAFAWSRWTEGLRPEPLLTVSEWAERFRVLPSVSAEPGRWRNSRTPYLSGVMDALSPSSTWERVVFMKGAQIGATEAGNNWIGYVIHNAPGLMLAVLPSLDDCKRNSATRIDPLIQNCPALRERVVEAKAKEPGNSIFRKRFVGGELILTGATSPKGLRSLPVRYLFMDEVDGYPGEAGDEGDPVTLAIQRTVTFRARRKIYMVSTPTVKGESRIEKAYAESDQRIYEVPCKHCGEFHWIVWADIHWPEGRRDLAYWACPSCGGVHEEHDKPALLTGGHWRATAEGDGRTAGFHLSALYSPFETWGEIALEHKAAGRDPVRLKAWTNLKLGETWEDRSGETIEPAVLQERAERWDRYLPAKVAVLTAAVDVQDDRLEVEVVGWGKDEESWSIDYRTIDGSPALLDVWQELDEFLKQKFPHALDAPDMPISACCIDSGGHHTSQVYTFVRTRSDRRIWAVKGWHTPAKAIWPRKPTRNNKGKVPLYMIGTDTAKDAIYSRLKIAEPGPGFMHFPAERPPSYFEGLTAERVRTKWVKGRPVREWIKHRDRNEPLDLKVYNLAALHGLVSLGFNLNREAARLAERHAPRNTNSTPASVKTSGSNAPNPPPRRPAIVGRSSYLG